MEEGSVVPPPASNNAAAEGSASTANAIAASQSTDSEKRHYKRLILRARSELENYQRQIGEKDRAIQELVKDREELRMRLRASELASKKVALENSQKNSAGSGAKRVPCRARRRVDVREDGDMGIWVLFDFEDDVVEWRRFASDEALQDFIRRDTGEPILIPPASLSPEESAKVVDESHRAVEKATEEFRRYRIRNEISRRQKEAETKHALGANILEQQRRINGQDVEGERQRARLQEEQLNSMREEFSDKEEEWRKVNEELKRENDRLRDEGSETTLAAQWRQRYEQCNSEKHDLVAKLAAVCSDEGVIASSIGQSGASAGDVEMGRRYQELREEYKLYRKRAMEAIQEKEMMLAQLAGKGSGDGSSRGSVFGARNSTGNMNPSFLRRQSSSMPEDPRLQYLKNLMIKYLCTEEFEAKEHMERAITTVLQFSEAECAFVAERRAESSVAWLTETLTGSFSSGSLTDSLSAWMPALPAAAT